MFKPLLKLSTILFSCFLFFCHAICFVKCPHVCFCQKSIRKKHSWTLTYKHISAGAFNKAYIHCGWIPFCKLWLGQLLVSISRYIICVTKLFPCMIIVTNISIRTCNSEVWIYDSCDCLACITIVRIYILED